MVVAVAIPAGAQEAPKPDAASSRADNRWNVEQFDRILAEQRGEDVEVGDMVFRRQVLQRHRDNLAGGTAPGAQSAASTSVSLWPGGTVYYTFDPSVSVAHQRHFLDAAAQWAAFAKVQFVVRATQANYVTVKDVPGLQGGTSAVGMAGGQQFLNIGSGSWHRLTLLHEIGHALGLVHEHQRSDRDAFVTILTSNIVPGRESAFVTLPTSNFGTYDFLSVMHYTRNAFSIDPAAKNTIVPTASYSMYLDVMGTQYDRPQSKLDRAGVASAYGPPTIAPSATVTSTSDSGPGSLRAAISFGFDRSEAAGSRVTTVTFAIPTTDPGFSGGVAVIKPTGPVPALGNRTAVDGTTQTASKGNTNPSGPEVAVNGVNIVAPEQYTAGFVLRGTGSAVKGIVVNGFNHGGVRITGTGATSNSVTGCYIGTNPAGTAAAPNTGSGVWVTGGARTTRIGGTGAGEGNLISGNGGTGVAITGAGTSANVVLGNTIGLGATGAAALPNNDSGIAVYDGARSNTVGGTAAGARNVISGNAGRGVSISGTGTRSNAVQGNTIGLSTAGAARPNNVGISIYGGATSNTIGGTATGAGNVISGNTSQGINIGEAGTSLNVVAGNLIGTDLAGTAVRANTGAGISIFAGAQSNTIGGTASGAGNTVSGNAKQGLTVSGPGTSSNKVQGNRIGLTAAGTAALANGWSGIQVFGGATANTIGGTAAAARNYISGNVNYGLTLSDAGTNDNLVHGNTVGQNLAGGTVPNGWGGVALWGGARSNQIGGVGTGAGNVIAGNSSNGVLVMDTATTGNAVRRNAMSGNAGLGINLSGGTQNSAGVTSNDAGDVDAGPNALLNYPVLSSAANSGTLVVQGTLSSVASTTYRVELFSSPTADPSTYGEGTAYLGFLNVATGAGGTSPTFTFSAATSVPVGYAITATATDPAGNTSEFSLRRLVS